MIVIMMALGQDINKEQFELFELGLSLQNFFFQMTKKDDLKRNFSQKKV